MLTKEKQSSNFLLTGHHLIIIIDMLDRLVHNISIHQRSQIEVWKKFSQILRQVSSIAVLINFFLEILQKKKGSGGGGGASGASKNKLVIIDDAPPPSSSGGWCC